MKTSATLDFYNLNAQKYAEDTVDVAFLETQKRFAAGARRREVAECDFAEEQILT